MSKFEATDAESYRNDSNARSRIEVERLEVELRARLIELPTPHGNEALLARILATRANGVRVMLTNAGVDDVEDAHDADSRRTEPAESSCDPERSGRSMLRMDGTVTRFGGRRALAVLTCLSSVAAAGVLWIKTPDLGGRDQRQVDARTVHPNDVPPEGGDALWSLLSPWPRPVGAQRPDMPAEATIIRGLDASTVRTRSWSTVTYNTVYDRTQTVRVTTTSVDRTTFEGRTVLRIVTLTNWQANARQSADTTLIDPRDLRPIRRRWHTVSHYVFDYDYRDASTGRARFIRRFTNAKTGAVRIDTLVLAVNPTGVVVEDAAQLSLLLRIVPLHLGMRFSVGQSRPILAGRASTPWVHELRVVGETGAATRWGTVPAWRLRFAGGKTEFLVSKATGDILEERSTWGNEGAVSVTELLTSP